MVVSLFILLCILCAADVITTVVGLKSVHAYETNPLLSPLMAKIGVLPTMLLGKAIFLPIVYLLGMNLIALSILNLIYVYVITNNIKIIFNLRKTAY